MLSTTELLDALRRWSLLEPQELDALAEELLTQTLAVRAPVERLVEQGWLTAYQVDQLLHGRGKELVLGPYVVLDCLGKGGMGAVYKARHRKLRRIDAVKVLRNDYLQTAGAAERFDREARAAAQLRHPNVVLVYDAGEADGIHYIAMEHVEGTDFSNLVKAQGALPIALACEYVRQAALGIRHIHECGLIHRDVKPSNLFLQTGGPGEAESDRVVKVLDLGLARFHPGLRGAAADTLTESNAVMGTPDFLAPEQAIDAHNVDARADLYSLGCTLYYLLSGEVPFPGSVVTVKLVGHQMHDPTPVEQHRPEIPGSVAQVVRKLMAKEASDRYQTAAEVAEALAAICQTLPKPPPTEVGEHRPPLAEVPGTRTPILVRKPGRGRVGWWLLLGMVVLLALGLGSWLVIVKWQPRLTEVSSVQPDSGGTPATSTPTPAVVVAPPTRVAAPTTSVPPATKAAPPRTKAEDLPKTLTIDLGGGVELEMVRIEPGELWMGSSDQEIDAILRQDKNARREELASEGPRHKVKITKPYYVGKFEVTQEQYQRVTGKAPSRFSASGEGKAKVNGLDTRQFPVETVSWEESTTFCNELMKVVEHKLPEVLRRQAYRFGLPTEAQWEHACRAGTKTAYYFGDELNGEQANCDGRSPFGTQGKGPYLGRTCKVGEHATANAFGLLDMHGNVWEWCEDYWDENFYKSSPKEDPVNTKKDKDNRHVLRGGSWLNIASTCRAGHRVWLSASERNDYVGLRVALRVRD